MSEPTPQFAGLSRALIRSRARWPGWAEAPSLGRVLEIALFLRLLAAIAVEWYVRRGGLPRVCIFPDAEDYWTLAGTIRNGTLYEVVEWGDIPHFARRTPGYPAFLAACQTFLGERPLGARVVQAGIGALTVWLVFRLSRTVLGEDGSRPAAGSGSSPHRRDGRAWTVPLVAALLAALHPYFIVMSVLLLSEAVFAPLMVAALWGQAVIWNGTAAGSASATWRASWIALGVGLASGAAILVRPSWALFVPVMLGAFAGSRIAATGRGGAPAAVRDVAVIVLGLCVVMSPWWVRNARIFGRFAPTAIWTGASLYDGLNPGATGASDMRFLQEPDIWPRDELDQDRELGRRALAFARERPGRALELALVKLGRYWSPWPSAEGFRSPVLTLVSTVMVLPLLALLALGLWRRRNDLRVWVLLAGPLLYFCVLHLVFVSSMRYRTPGEVPAMGLAAVGVMTITRGKQVLAISGEVRMQAHGPAGP